jgi:hypothetical protein
MLKVTIHFLISWFYAQIIKINIEIQFLYQQLIYPEILVIAGHKKSCFIKQPFLRIEV